ncbi:glycosyltransferase family 4 protein [Acidihalobacter ferrooxydans]|uniref:glycosyltransferase family 4 protein n=1 Tax=Acidihalobacter ferrooxydans TaxID=1765967 RepID=UPI0012EC83CD|nr:glycosyltransferase [Acidihalobacter ferrooxydans]
MKILILADVPPDVIGGAEMQAWRLARAWRDAGHDVEIAGHRIPDVMREGIRLHHLPVFKRAGRALRGATYFAALAWFLTARKRSSYDLIYCRFIGEAALSMAVLKQLRLIHAPLVAVPAASGREGNADLALLHSLPATDRLIGLLNRQCDCVNYIAPGIEQTFREAGLAPRQTTRIPNGVDLPAWEAREPPGPELLFVGRLAPQKGLDLLLPVLARLRASGRDFLCTLIGDGPLRGKLESQARDLGLGDCVTFMGAQPQTVVRAQLAKARAFVLPSRYEGLSNAALEALAHGVPCVLSRCGGVDACLTEESGWVFDVGDATGLETALQAALDLTPQRHAAMSRACRKLVEEHFSLEKVARQYLDCFSVLVSAKA